MPVIRPAPGEGPALARLLLDLADHPRDVAVTTDGGLGFIVPTALEDRWLEAVTAQVLIAAAPTPVVDAPPVVTAVELAVVSPLVVDEPIVEVSEETTPPRRGPGRPRKSTVDDTPEE